MAGDWLKVEKDTPDKPEVFRIAELLGITRAEAFLACFRVWCWADSQTQDGIIKTSSAAIDDTARVLNFHHALREVGWLNLRTGAVELPKFIRHMGMSAKRRCLDSVRKMSARQADKTRTREEKRREEKSSSSSSRRVSFSIPSVEEVRAYCAERGNAVDAQQFVDHYTSNGWRVGRNPMRDWRATVRKWERSEFPNGRPRAGPSGESLEQRAKRLYEEMQCQKATAGSPGGPPITSGSSGSTPTPT